MAILMPVMLDANAAVVAILAQDQRALMPIVVAQDASPRVRQAATILADYLGRISDTVFSVTPGDGVQGIVIGLPSDFPNIPIKQDVSSKQIENREHYLLRSHSKGLYLIGATEIAVEDAVWDLLHRLGYRQFFPGPTWEIIPKIPTLTIAVDADERPDYLSRRIWYGGGTWDYNAEYYRQWTERNRVREDAFGVNSGHAYETIIHSYQSEFDAHPEYLCQLENGSNSSKFKILNPDLQKVVIRYALNFFKTNPKADSVSVEPSDSGGWCEEKGEGRLLSTSDRVLLLANQVATSLEKKYADKYVVFYAYNIHSPPPEIIRAHPNVIVNIATSFILGGYTVDQLIEGWRKIGVRQIGIREYYSVDVWDYDLPGSSSGSDLEYLAQSIPHFHALGARFMSAGSSDNWGINGLGYYVASRLLWRVDDAKHLDSIIDDFIQKSFGPARGPMTKFYALINRANRPLLSQDLVGRMYRLLDDAAKLTDDPKIQARLNDLTLYTRYVELFRKYQAAQGNDRQNAFEQVIRHAYRMRGTMMIHTKALYADLPRYDRSVHTPEGAAWGVPEGKNPWKSSQPFTDTELQEIRRNGMAQNPLLTWTPATYNHHLIPLLLPDQKDTPGSKNHFLSRGPRQFFIWVDQAPATLHLKVTGGLITHYRNRGSVKIDWYAMKTNSEYLVDSNYTVQPDGQERTVILKINQTGLHRLDVDDGNDLTLIVFEPREKVVLAIGQKQTPLLFGRQTLYFYVPRGVKTIGGYRTGDGRIEDAAGDMRYQPKKNDAADYFTIQISQGQDRQIWRCFNCTGVWRLMTVPPYFAASPQQLLVPSETVDWEPAQK